MLLFLLLLQVHVGCCYCYILAYKYVCHVCGHIYKKFNFMSCTLQVHVHTCVRILHHLVCVCVCSTHTLCTPLQAKVSTGSSSVPSGCTWVMSRLYYRRKIKLVVLFNRGPNCSSTPQQPHNTLDHSKTTHRNVFLSQPHF